MHAWPANCTSSREAPRFKVGRRIHSRGSAILFLAACRATLILGDRGHKGRRVGRLAGEREEKSPLLSIWIRRRDENTPFVSSNACPFSPPPIPSSFSFHPSPYPPSLSSSTSPLSPSLSTAFVPRSFFSFLPRAGLLPSAPSSPDGTRDQNLHPYRVSGIMKGPPKRSPLTTQLTRLV